MVNTAERPTTRRPPAPDDKRRWSRAAGLLGVVTLAAAMARLVLPPVPDPLAIPPWVPVAAAALGVVAWALAAPSPHGTAGRWLRRMVVGFAWSACVTLLVAAAGIAFDVVGTAMWAVAALTGELGPVQFPIDPAGSATRGLALASGVAWGAVAVSAQRRLRDACAGCGRKTGSYPARSSTFRAGRWAAYLAGLLALGYGALKAQWGLGGDIGLSRPDALGEVHLWTPGLGDTAVLAAIGVALALALVRPWGRRLPRWMPIAGAFVGCAMLIPVGLLASYATLLDVLAGQVTNGPFAPWVRVGIYPWFLAWGISLAVAAWSYTYRTRGRCARCSQSGT